MFSNHRNSNVQYFVDLTSARAQTSHRLPGNELKMHASHLAGPRLACIKPIFGEPTRYIKISFLFFEEIDVIRWGTKIMAMFWFSRKKCQNSVLYDGQWFEPISSKFGARAQWILRERWARIEESGQCVCENVFISYTIYKSIGTHAIRKFHFPELSNWHARNCTVSPDPAKSIHCY